MSDPIKIKTVVTMGVNEQRSRQAGISRGVEETPTVW